MQKIMFWDWTGTLADESKLDEAVCRSLEEDIARERGITFADAVQVYKEFLKTVENTWNWHDYVQHGNNFGVDWKHSQKINLDKLQLVPHAREILAYTASKRYQNVLVTNAVRGVILLRVKHVGLIDSFRAIIASSDVKALKAEGKHFKHGLTLLNGNSKQSFSVGDNPIQDIQSAKNLGLRAIYCEFGKNLTHYHSQHISENHKETINADFSIQSLEDIKNII
ncbi:HAD family hydrolase [Acidobacteriota bacterium]